MKQSRRLKEFLLRYFFEHRGDFVCWLILLLVAWTATTFFAPDSPKLGGDDRFPLAPSIRLEEYLNVWSHLVRMLGGPIPMRVATIFPSVSLLALLEKMKFSIVVWQQVEFFLLYAIALVGTYLFALILVRNKVIAVAAAIFYITSPFSLAMLNVSREGMYLWVAYPLLLATFIGGLVGKKGLMSVAAFALSSLLASPGSINPPTLAVVFISLALFWSYFFFLSKNKKPLVLYGLLCAMFYFLVNLWWVLPSVNTYKAYSQEFIGTYDPVVYAREASSYTSLLALMRLSKRGDMPPLQSGYYGFHFLPIYDLVTFLPTVLVMLAPLLARRNRRLVAFYCFTTFFFLFLSKGSHPPFEFIYEWLLRHIPGFSMFRSPADKFNLFLTLGYSFLIGVTFSELIERVKNLAKRTVLSFLYILAATPLVLLFRTGLHIPYELKYGNFLVVGYLFLIGLFLMSLFLNKKSRVAATFFSFFYFTALLFLDRMMFTSPLANFTSPLANFGLVKIFEIFALSFIAGLLFFRWFLERKAYILALSFIIVAFPFIFTHVANHLNGVIKFSSSGAMIPDYYLQAKNWLQSQKEDFRLLSLPSNAVVVAYHWPTGGGFGGYDFVAELFGRPTIDFLAGDIFTEPIRFQVLKMFGEASFKTIHPDLVLTQNVANILRLMNVKYLMVHNDFWWQYYGTDDPKKVASSISLQNGIKLKQKFGQLDFYEVEDTLPHIYAAPQAYLVSGSPVSLTTLAESDYLKGSPALIISDQQSKEQLSKYYQIGGNLLFENSTYSDLALDFLKNRFGLFASYPQHLDELTLNYSGDYELWVQSEKLRDLGVVDLFLKKPNEVLPRETININSYIYDLVKQRWTKVGERRLEKGKYYLLSPELIITSRLGKMVLVPKIIREKEEEFLITLVNQGKLLPEFYFSPKRYLLSSQKQIYDLEPALKRTFTIAPEQKKEYRLRSAFQDKFLYQPSRRLAQVPKFDLITGLTDFDNWGFLSETTRFEIKNKRPLQLLAKFEKDSSTPEGIFLTKEETVDLKRHPFLFFSYTLEDLRIQDLNLKIAIDADGDNLADDQLELLSGGLKSEDTLVLNILDIVQKRIPNKKEYRVIKIDIEAKKIIGADGRRLNKTYLYTFDYLGWWENIPPRLFSPMTGFNEYGSGMYEFTEHQKIEDFVGYVYQPGLDFGFRRVLNTSKFISAKDIFFFSKGDDRLVLKNQKMPIAIDGLDSGTPEIEIAFKLSSRKGLSFFTEPRKFKIEQIQEMEYLNVAGLTATPSGRYLSGIEIKSEDIRDYNLDGLRITANGKSFEYQVSNVLIYNAQESVPLGNAFKGVQEQEVTLNSGQNSVLSTSHLPKFVTYKLPFENKGKPRVNTKKVSFSKYLVEVETESPFWLVFSESYNSQWQAYLQNESLFQKIGLGGLVSSGIFLRRELVDNHFLVNGYANGWYLDKVGQYQIILEYTPQILLEIGLLVSGLTVAILILYICKKVVFGGRRRVDVKKSH